MYIPGDCACWWGISRTLHNMKKQVSQPHFLRSFLSLINEVALIKRWRFCGTLLQQEGSLRATDGHDISRSHPNFWAAGSGRLNNSKGIELAWRKMEGSSHWTRTFRTKVMKETGRLPTQQCRSTGNAQNQLLRHFCGHKLGTRALLAPGRKIHVPKHWHQWKKRKAEV